MSNLLKLIQKDVQKLDPNYLSKVIQDTKRNPEQVYKNLYKYLPNKNSAVRYKIILILEKLLKSFVVRNLFIKDSLHWIEMFFSVQDQNGPFIRRKLVQIVEFLYGKFRHNHPQLNYIRHFVNERNSIPIPVQLNPVDARIQEYRKQKYLKIVIEEYPELCSTLNRDLNMLNNTLELVGDTDLIENSETRILFDSLREQYGVLLICKNKVDRWLSLVTKAEDEDTARQQEILKRLIDTKMELGILETVQNLLDRVEIVGDSDDSDGFEDLDDYEPTAKVPKAETSKPVPSPKKSLVFTKKSTGLQPVFIKTNQTSPLEDEVEQPEIINPELKEYFEKAPIVEYGQDLEYWSQKPTFHQISSNAVLQSHRFMGASDDKELPLETIEQLTKRPVYLEPAPQPEIQECGAKLKNGNRCKRKDLKKCPFHGPIIPRDELGNALDPTQEVVKETVPEWKKAIEREKETDRSDPNTIRLSKKKSSKHNIRQVLKKTSSGPDLMDQYKRRDKSVFRW
ncbi:hypothetical protein HDV04_002146 [Boothiomyces sp. JEL0838]|nr:hypothetical protein HDV04_002146 [Boothiomyces sp. JEL0838]